MIISINVLKLKYILMFNILFNIVNMVDQIENSVLRANVKARVAAYRERANEIIQRFPVLQNLKIINLCQRFPG